MPTVALCMPVTKVTRDMIFTINEFILSTGPDSEVVIVIDGGNDEGLLESFYYLGSRLKVVVSKTSQGPATARNLAARLSNSEILVFADYDVLVGAPVFNFLGDAKQGEIRIPSVFPQVPSKVARFFSALALSPKRNGTKILPPSACFSIQKSDFLMSKGFDESFKRAAGEDWEFFSRVQDMGLKINYDINNRVFHQNPRTLIGLARRSFRYGLHGSDSLKYSPDISIEELDQVQASLAHLPILIPLVLSGAAKILLSSLSLGEDSFSSLAKKISNGEKQILRTLGLETGGAAKKRYSRFTSSVISACLGISTHGPWTNSVAYKPGLDSEYRSYRFLIITWRIVFSIGLVIGLIKDKLKAIASPSK